jgi:outer membrane protein OmpA-like peptidoglycan-associated protein/flagellar hook assembly protein FlgD
MIFISKDNIMKNKTAIFIAILAILQTVNLAAEPQRSPFGADAVPDIYSPSLGGGAFTTSTGAAPFSAINPAQGGDARRLIFDAGYIAIPALDGMGKENGGYMQSISAGGLFPTKYGVFGASLRYIGGFTYNQFDYFPINPTFGGNVFAAKELYPGMSLGMGINFGFGAEKTISADLGYRYNIGSVGFLENFTMAFVLRGLGLSYFPTWFTPAAGLSFDLVSIKGAEGKNDPFSLHFAADISIPSAFYPKYINVIFKAGIDMVFAELITLSVAWPGGSGLNFRELRDKASLPVLPSVGLTINIVLPTGGRRIAGGRLPSDGDLKIHGVYKPLYEGITALGGGLSWYVGVADKKPPDIKLDYPQTAWFSPNNDGKADYLEFPVSITDQNHIVSWAMEIKDEGGNIVRTIENKEQRFDSFDFGEFFSRIFKVKNQIEIPPALRWDGITNNGNLAPDGRYYFTITATDDSGNTAVTNHYDTVIRNTPPQIAITPIPDAQKIFDPKGTEGGGRRNISIAQRGSVEEAWESGIWNAAGEKVRTFETESGSPSARVWDGRNDAGNIAPDGVYSYRISVTDRAQNSASAELTNIILDSREAGVFLTTSVSAIAPQPNQSANMVNFSIRLLLQDGIESWKLELKDQSGNVQRTFSGTTQVPPSIGWNGFTETGTIQEGVFTPQLTINYTRGDMLQTSAAGVLVDVTGPLLSLRSSPEFFSPDNDGDNDELIINLSAQDASPIASWTLEIREPEAPYPVFRRFEGRGTPSPRLIWDGKSARSELVQSATNYPWTFTASDTLGNSSSIEGIFGIDVLVIRDGDNLKIQIPSIVFRPNFADFDGLSAEIVDNNVRILRRIAQILNQFRDYRVQVEGHANATQPPGPARDREQAELRTLSEARARAVVDQLVRYGVARNRLSFIGAGASSPVVAFEDRDNWWKNRRVEFILIK